jgi:hypothetical protein
MVVEWQAAMRWASLLAAALFWTAGTTRAGPYEDCILQNMRGVQASNAALAIAGACREKTTPYRCKAIQIEQRIPPEGAFDDLVRSRGGKANIFDQFDSRADKINTEKSACLAQCATASYWSRTFGECRIE